LLERAGTCEGQGSITGIYTVLVEGDDVTEPVADAMRSILDGHVLLSRRLADQGHYPAIEVLGSVSRLITALNPQPVLAAGRQLMELMAAYQKAEDLINIGAYVEGSNPNIDRARRLQDRINAFLLQGQHEKVDLKTSRQQLLELVNTPDPPAGTRPR
jgi:flagellum-specific ATP synthase